MSNPKDNPLVALINTELSSVEFVRDYYQLKFDGPMLNVISYSKIITNTGVIEHDSSMFCNLLLSCIGKKVVNTSLQENDSAKLSFNNDVEIYISLKSEDYRGAEALIFYDDPNGGWWVW